MTSPITDISTAELATAAIAAWLFWLLLRIFTTGPFDPWPIVGHLRHGLYGRQTKIEWMFAAQKHFDGRSWSITIPGVLPRAHIISDPAVLKYITLNKHLLFTKQGHFAQRMKDYVGQGIVVATGANWQAQHQAAHAFSAPETLERLTSKVLPRHLHLIFDALDSAVADEGIIDLDRVIVQYILAVFGDIALDVSWDEIKDLSDVLDHTVDAISWRFNAPGYQLWEWVLPYGYRLRRNLKIVRSTAVRIVRDTQEKMRAEEIGEREVDPEAGFLIRALLREDLSEEVVADACVTFINAGRSPTSHAISWAVYELLNQPHHLTSLHTVLDYESDHTKPTGQLIRSTPILSNIVSEAVRLHPSTPIETLQLNADADAEACTLPDGTIVQPGETLFWSIWGINRSSKTFGPDAEAFKPERWEAMERKPTAYEFASFYSGPRACPGQQMGRLQIAFFLVEVFRRYELSPAWTGAKVLDEGIGGEMRGGLPVRVTRRAVAV